MWYVATEIDHNTRLGFIALVLCNLNGFHNIVHTGWTKAYKETAKGLSVDSQLRCFFEGNINFSRYSLHHNIHISSMLLGYNEYWRYECMPRWFTFWYVLEMSNWVWWCRIACWLQPCIIYFVSYGRTLDLGLKLFSRSHQLYYVSCYRGSLASIAALRTTMWLQ